MKFTYIWKKEKRRDEVEVISHPSNEQLLRNMATSVKMVQTIHVKNPKNDRTQTIPLDEVEAIFALGHISKVLTIGEPP